MQALALKLGWGSKKKSRLYELLTELVIIKLSQGNIVDHYATIDHYCEREVSPARPMGQNDKWIAACAAATQANLLTTDKDFDPLHPTFLNRSFIDPDTGQTL